MKKYIDIVNLKKSYSKLTINDMIYLTGKVYTARDAAHKRLIEMILNKKDLPIDIKGSIIYYTGPTPAKPDMIIGSCGPTSSYRLDEYIEPLLKLGLLGMIGKGNRSKKATKYINRYKAIYFTAIGGAGALACKYVKASKEVAFLDLGCESIKELYIEKFPVIVSEI